MIQKLKDFFNSASIFIVVFLLAFSITSQIYLTKQIQVKQLLNNRIKELMESYNELFSRYKDLRKQSYEATKKLIELQQVNAEYAKKIAELDNIINYKNAEIMALRKDILQLDDQLKALVAKENEGTCQDQLLNVRQQRDIWVKKFSLAQKEIEAKDSIIFSLSEQYNLEHELRLKWEQKANEEYGLRVSWQTQAEQSLQKLAEANRSLADAYSVLKREQAKSRWYRFGLYALGGALVFSLVK
jgi:chromosome segregation ATPase